MNPVTVLSTPKIYPGWTRILGATWDGNGVNFALFSEHATKVELCLFDSPEQTRETCRIPLPEKTYHVWHGYVPGLKPGQLYGFRVHGAYDPKQGHRFNRYKVLLDPYAKALGRSLKWREEMFGYKLDAARQDLTMDRRDNAAYAPLGVVIDPAFDWGNDEPPRIPWHETIIYETHVKGMTKLHPEVPENLRGTYAGLVTKPVIEHLKSLGITAVELLPVHHFINEGHLVEKGLTNYWGYNTLAYFAPQTRYSSDPSPQGSVNEFKMMVKKFHEAGIEVILDVVYNHTAEGNHLGPTLSFRGIDNTSYYRLMQDNPRFYQDFSGCGNTLSMRHPRVLQMLMDSLRYWILEMHVDGFRFDLASALARELYDVDRLSGFFDIIQQDPVINQAKLIAEPWDVGAGGYQVGNFPPGWTEWNGKYRDVIRGFWKGDEGTASEFATRICGSSDLYEEDGRRPYASINFVTCHDGFTLQDLVSYNEKHNKLNGEENRDGENYNLSWNCGLEGPTLEADIIKLREQQKRNFIATLFLSQGVPMILGGDEISRSQSGNNNAYCQDNEYSWFHWTGWNDNQWKFLNFMKDMIRLRKQHPVLRRRHFFQGRSIRGGDVKDIIWFEPSGEEMSDQDWVHYMRCIGYVLSGTGNPDIDEKGEPILGDTLLVLMNAYHKTIPFRLPEVKQFFYWEILLDTADGVNEKRFKRGFKYPLQGRSLAVFRAVEKASVENSKIR